MSKRRALAVAPLDLHILGDAKFQRLMRKLPRPEFREAFALYVELLIQAHSQDRRDVISDWCDSDDVEPLNHLRSVGLIDEVGIPEEPFEEWRHADKLSFDSAAQAERGRKRVEGAKRDERGRLLPADDHPASDQRMTTRLVPAGPASEPGTVRYGTATHTSEGDTSNDVDERFVALAKLIEELTGRRLYNPFGGMTVIALELIDQHGWEKFEERVRLVAGRLERPSLDEIIFNTKDSLRRKVATADVAKEERQEETESDFNRRLERTQITAHDGGGHVDPSLFPRCPKCRGEVAV